MNRDITPKKPATPPDKRSGSAPAISSKTDISTFLQAASKLKNRGDGAGGLIFALDATMSRGHTWDEAQKIQAEMFNVVEDTGGLDVQLVYFRGYGECRASKWVTRPAALRDLMTGIDTRGGQTQIGKVLAHAVKEAGKKNPQSPDRSRVDALVFVGDAMEENPDTLCHRAGQLKLLGVPCFMFQEGHDGNAERTFREIARLSGGAFMRFGPGSAARLADLLKAVARFVSGGRAALEDARARGDKGAQALLEQLK
ncbi:MAG: VWA domain-containing protein [Pseudomonadota bacterium]